MNKRKYNDLMNQRSAHISAAEEALAAGNQEGYNNAMAAAEVLNPELENLRRLITEEERFDNSAPANAHEASELAIERANALQNGETISFSAREVLNGLRMGGALPDIENSTTLATGTLVQPTGASSEIRDGFFGISSIIDEVRSINLTGMGSFLEPYVKSELEAKGGKVTTTAGKLRDDSSPEFRNAKISPYEATVTSYVDRNISKLSPADYSAKIFGMALRALRRKVAQMIFVGDGQASPDMYGVTNAKNTKSEDIFKTLTADKGLSLDLLMDILFAYGGDEELGGSARLYLTLQDLMTIGKFRGANEKRRLFDIEPTAGNPNTGVIRDGGLVIPYTIGSALGSLSGSAPAAAGVATMAYGDPYNYELGLFGNFDIRVSDDYKAGERMLTILGDVMVGGNLIVDNGFIVVKAAESATP